MNIILRYLLILLFYQADYNMYNKKLDQTNYLSFYKKQLLILKENLELNDDDELSINLLNEWNNNYNYLLEAVVYYHNNVNNIDNIISLNLRNNKITNIATLMLVIIRITFLNLDHNTEDIGLVLHEMITIADLFGLDKLQYKFINNLMHSIYFNKINKK